MIFIYITWLNDKGEYREFSFANISMETAFDFLNSMVKNDCKLFSVHYSTDSEHQVFLPIEAFDGQPVREQLIQLEQEWKAILAY